MSTFEPKATSSRNMLGLAAFSALAFVALLILVLPAGHAVGLDVRVVSWVVQHRASGATEVFRTVTNFGSVVVLVPAAILIGGYFLIWRRNWHPIAWLTITLAGTSGLYDLGKGLVARPRPPASLRITDVAGWSFPSGHSSQAVAFWVMAAILVGAGRPRRARVWLLATAIGLALLIGGSRVYLGAHWTTDVLAGWSLGACWLSIVLLARASRPSRLPAASRPHT